MFFSSTSIFFSLLFLARDGVGLFSALRSRAERKGSSSGDREKITRKTNERRSKTKSSSREKRKRNLNLFSPLLQKPLHQFDSAFLAALSTKVAGRASFKGGLDTYRFCDSVWTFLLRDAVVKLPAGPGGRPPAREEIVKKIKIVAVDSRLAATTTAAGAK